MELLYTVDTKDTIEIIVSVVSQYAFMLIGLIGMFLFRKHIKIAEEQEYTNVFLLIFTLFIVLFSGTEYYTLFTLNNKLKVALSNQKKCSYIEGITKQYIYSGIKRQEWFFIDNIRFDIQDSPKLIKNKSLRYKVEYIKFPRNSTVVVRIWRLSSSHSSSCGMPIEVTTFQ